MLFLHKCKIFRVRWRPLEWIRSTVRATSGYQHGTPMLPLRSWRLRHSPRRHSPTFILRYPATERQFNTITISVAYTSLSRLDLSYLLFFLQLSLAYRFIHVNIVHRSLKLPFALILYIKLSSLHIRYAASTYDKRQVMGH